MASVIIIGGGIIGLCSAYYLQQTGNEVTVLDKSDMLDGCSYGNAGYLSPSHFVPLASPGIVKQGFKWMLNPRSPFYVQPRASLNLLNWGKHFIKSATQRHSERSAIPLRDISLLSKTLFEELSQTPGFTFSYENKGMIEVFKTTKSLHHAEEMVKQAALLSLDAVLLSKKEVELLEPDLYFDILGAAFYKCDAHLYPNKLMADLVSKLKAKGVIIKSLMEVIGFQTTKNKINLIKTNSGDFKGDEVVLAAGALTGNLAKMLNLKIPMIGGRGYSVTYDHSNFKVHHPIILQEGRVAITPMAGKVRFGGTMEITSLNAPPQLNRVHGIFDWVKRYFPKFDLPFPPDEKVWSGFRPCSADGLPYIGRHPGYSNLVIASGHSMLGLSLGPATGILVSQIINNLPVSIDLQAFNPERFRRKG